MGRFGWCGIRGRICKPAYLSACVFIHKCSTRNDDLCLRLIFLQWLLKNNGVSPAEAKALEDKAKNALGQAGITSSGPSSEGALNPQGSQLPVFRHVLRELMDSMLRYRMAKFQTAESHSV